MSVHSCGIYSNDYVRYAYCACGWETAHNDHSHMLKPLREAIAKHMRPTIGQRLRSLFGGKR